MIKYYHMLNEYTFEPKDLDNISQIYFQKESLTPNFTVKKINEDAWVIIEELQERQVTKTKLISFLNKTIRLSHIYKNKFDLFFSYNNRKIKQIHEICGLRTINNFKE